jgi:hypothetical protein
MKIIIKVWHRLISYSLGINEKIFFYSKLRKFYLSNDIKDPVIFDIGANKGQSIDFFRGVFKKSIIDIELQLTQLDFVCVFISCI